MNGFNAGAPVVPYAKRRRGIDEVKDFFVELGAAAEVQHFEPREFFAAGDRVVVLGAWSGRTRTPASLSPATG